VRYSTDGIQPSIGEYHSEIVALRRLAASPEINRLNHVKQLSTTYLSTALGGAHSRLEHTLGAFDSAIRLLEVANDYMRTHASSVELYAINRKSIVRAALVLAFFHDAYHAPFGHVLDPLCSILLPFTETTRIDNAARYKDFVLMLSTINGDSTLPEEESMVLPLLRRVFSDESELKSVAEWCVAFLDCYRRGYVELPDDFRSIAFVFDILWSAADHDRLDYVCRDESHLLVFDAPSYSVTEIAKHCECREDPASGEVRLVFGGTSGEYVERMLLRRHRLYNLVYESRYKAPYDEMILHSAAFLLEDHDLLTRSFDSSFGLEFVRLSDLDFIRLITEVGDSSPRSFVARLLLRDVLNNAPFWAAYHRDIDNSEIPTIAERYAVLRPQVQSRVNDVVSKSRAGLGFRPSVQATQSFYDSLRKLLEAPVRVTYSGQLPPQLMGNPQLGSQGEVTIEIENLEGESLFWVLALFGPHMQYRLHLERAVWSHVRQYWSGYNAWELNLEDTLCRTSWAEYSDSDKAVKGAELRTTLRSLPLTLIFMSRMVPSPGLLLKDYTSERKALSISSDNELEELTITPQDVLNNYWISVFRPPSMDASVDKVIVDYMENHLLPYGWLEEWVAVNADPRKASF
jgi:HD superfamily phosphohydrolase